MNQKEKAHQRELVGFKALSVSGSRVVGRFTDKLVGCSKKARDACGLAPLCNTGVNW